MPRLPSVTYGVEEVLPQPGWHLAAHWHGQVNQLIVVLEGALRLRTPTDELVAGSGDLLFYPAGLVHEESSLPGEPLHTLYMSFHQPGFGTGISLRQRDSEGRVRLMAGWLLRDLATGRSTEQCRPLYTALLDEVTRLAASPEDVWVRTIRAHFQRELAVDHSLASMAEQAGMSRSAFAHKYKRLTGHSPMADLRLIRLQTAYQQLQSTAEPLKIIASAVGLGDEFQLSKLFRRCFGFPPSQLRSTSKRPERTRGRAVNLP